MSIGLAVLAIAGCAIAGSGTPGRPSNSAGLTGIDFAYAFAVPHRMAVARPDSGDKTLLDLWPGNLRISWTFGDLTKVHPGALSPPKTEFAVRVTPAIDGRSFTRSTWTRADGYLPILDNVYQDRGGTVRLLVAGGGKGMVCKVQVTNTDSKEHVFCIRCAGEVPAVHADAPAGSLLGSYENRADRLLMLTLGTEPGVATGSEVSLQWRLGPAQSGSGWIIRPYRAYAAEASELRQYDWSIELDTARKEWKELLDRTVRVQIPDPGVRQAFYACLGDIFIMRELAANGWVAGTAGTEGYRSHNQAEPGIGCVCLDQVGLHSEAETGYRLCIAGQDDDGCWADSKAWERHYWWSSGWKCWVVMQHYLLTRDRAYLAAVYPRMLASSRWQERQRAGARVTVDGKRPITYGLLGGAPADCGLAAGGVYFAHNIWAVYADRVAMETAEILGKSEDVPELQRIYRHGLADLMQALEMGSIRQDGCRWIPGAPNSTAGSQWGTLHILSPCRILPPDHELVTGSIRHMESNLSPGGLAMHTGFMADGMWVAISLEHLGECHLMRDEGDAFARYLYAVLNHGTPLYTWCEERGKDAGAANTSGDRQHLYTPVAVVRGIRDCLVMEEGDSLHLCRGTAREWLAGGRPVGIQKAPTHFGPVSFRVQFNAATGKVNGEVSFPGRIPASQAVLHLRLPGGLKVRSVSPESRAKPLPDGTGIRWISPRGERSFTITVG